jgi:hypothetical protein
MKLPRRMLIPCRNHIAPKTGLLFGLTPALRASQVYLNDALKDLTKATAGHAQHGLRNLLVVAEVALAFVLKQIRVPRFHPRAEARL